MPRLGKRPTVPKAGFVRETARVREHQGMMHDAAVRRPELYGADKPVAREIHRHNEAFVEILTFRRYIERLR
jgi:hypothetical protein